MSLIDPVVAVSSGPSDSRERKTARRIAFEFAAVFALILGGAGVWKMIRAHSLRAGGALVVAAAAILVYSLVHPTGALVLRKGWMRVGAVLGRVNTTILLTLLYIVLITPLGLVFRLLRRRAGKPGSAGSYFHARDAERGREHFEHPY